MSQQSHREIAKRYLLGTLSEDERERLEQQYFSDDPQFEEIEILEDDLVDQYIRNELTTGDRKDFEEALSKSPRLRERIEMAKLLMRETSLAPAPVVPAAVPKRSSWRAFFWTEKPARVAYAFAVLLVLLGGLAVATAWLKLRQDSRAITARQAELQRQNQEITRQQAEMQAKNQQWESRLQEQQTQLEAERQSIEKQLEDLAHTQTSLSTFLYLRPGTLRSADQRAEKNLDPRISTINLQLPLPNDDYQRYRAVVLNPDLQPVSPSRVLTPRRSRSGRILVFSLATKKILPGDYFVRVEGIKASGGTETVDDYPFRLSPPR